MRRQLVITDLTRMHGDGVCVAGVLLDGDDRHRCVRPEHQYRRLTERWLYHHGAIVIRPFAVVALDLLTPDPHPPHTEDWIVNDRFREYQGLLTTDERRDLLRNLDDGCVEQIFGATVHQTPGWFVRSGEGNRSLGTIRPAAVLGLIYAPRTTRPTWSYRIAFADQANTVYNLAITDLAFRAYLDVRRTDMNTAPARVAREMRETLRQADDLCLRVGLARGGGEGGERCHLQINGIYTFPDYLDGRCFTDLVPDPWRALDLSGVPF